MSDSDGDFESADEDAAVVVEAKPPPPAKQPATEAVESATASGSGKKQANAAEGEAPPAPVVTNQPPTAAAVDADGPTVELSFGGSGGGSSGVAGSGWTSWGLSWGQSIITGAKSGVSVLAKELGDGIGTVSRTVESVLEAPSPEDMAGGVADGATGSSSSDKEAPPTVESAPRSAGASAEAEAAAQASTGTGGSWLRSGWRVGGALTTSVTQTGSYLVSGGLDLLEAVGKRTMDALQETDPGFQRTKVLLGRGRRPNLSELLREAQASGGAAAAAAASTDGATDAADADADSADFACQFDRVNGSAYLDALQTLAGQCELRLQAKLSTRPEMRPAMADIFARLERVRGDGAAVGDDDDEADAAGRKPAALEAALRGLPAHFGPANAWLSGAVDTCLRDGGDDAPAEQEGKDVAALQVDCVRRLAGLTAATLHYLVKAASLASAAAASATSAAPAASPPAEAASRMADLCFALTGCADLVRERACVRMQAAASAAAAASVEVDEHAVNQAMTQAILEAEGSKAYVQDAFLLLAPVLQLAALDEPAPTASAGTTVE